jgi:hypothetical protein
VCTRLEENPCVVILLPLFLLILLLDQPTDRPTD